MHTKLSLRFAYHPEGNRTLRERERDVHGSISSNERDGSCQPEIASGEESVFVPQGETREREMSTIRLAYGNSPPERNGTAGFERERADDESSAGALSRSAGRQHPARAARQREARERESRPALLVSFVYLKPFLKNRDNYAYRDWVLDSGAFSAHASGTEIDLQEYIETCQELLASDSTLTEVFALDVIGDWKASLANCEEMWKQGVPAIPAYHVGEPESVLLSIAKEYPKIALGGAVGYRAKDKWAAQCFARTWPKPIHGFGFGSEKSIMALPWHSVDATNWELGPCKFGRWNSFGQMSVRGSNQNLRAEVEWYLKLEQRARQKWGKQMAELEAQEREPRGQVSGGRIDAASASVDCAEREPDGASSCGRNVLGQKPGAEQEARERESDDPIRSQWPRGSRGAESSGVREEGLKLRLAVDPGAAGGKRLRETIG